MMTATRGMATQPRMLQFYHSALRTSLFLVCLCLQLPIALAASNLPSGNEGYKAPPRTIDDLTRLLEHYKPQAETAAKALTAANRPVPESTDPAVLFDFYLNRGAAAMRIGRMSQQLSDLRKATEYGKARRDREQIRALRDLSSAEVTGGNLLRAIAAAEEAVSLVDMQSQGQALGAYQQLTQMYVLVGDFENARRCLKRAEEIYAILRNAKNWTYYGDNWTANLERARGELFRAEGKLSEAEGAYRKALRALGKYLDDLKGGMLPPNFTPADLERAERFQEVLLRSLGQSLSLQNKLVDAEIYFRQALRLSLSRIGRDAVDTGTTLMALSNCLSEQGRFAEGGRLAEEALRSFELAGAAPESLFLAQSRRALATSYVAQRRYPDAIRMFEQMRANLQGDPALAGKLLNGDLDWVLAMLRTGDQEGAEKMALAMLQRAQKKQTDALRLAELQAFHAMTLAARGAQQEALQAFAQAVPVLIEQSRNDDEGGTVSIKRQKRLVNILESYISVLHAHGHESAAADSFRLADIARGSSVQRALTASAARASITDPVLAELARKEQDAQQRIAALSETLRQLLAAPPEQQLPQVQNRMRADIEALKQERSRLKKELEQRFPDYIDLVDPKPATLQQTRKLLKPGEALVAWYFGEQEGWVWGVGPDGRASFAKVPFNRSQIAEHVQKLRKALDPGVASIDDIPAFDLKLGYELYAGLLQPVASSWQGVPSLLAIPHAELGQLPLSLLPTAAASVAAKTPQPFADYRQVPWLARQIAVAQLPSVTALASLRKLPAAGEGRRAFIGFGDPFFSADQAKQASKVAQADTSLATRGGKAMRLRNVPKTAGVSSAELSLLPRLPDTSQELRDIAGVLKADPSQDIYLQTRATVKTVMNTDLTQRRVVMFATHGLVPGELDGLTQPALALTSPEVADPDSDGLLTMDKILTLKLNADWVVLSACNTAAGEGSGAEAVSGLGRAFFFAGTRALLVSNWPVETVAARKLMTDLFRRQTADAKLGKAEALRQAMLALIDGPGNVDAVSGKSTFSYAHPLFWAPFVVVGD